MAGFENLVGDEQPSFLAFGIVPGQFAVLFKLIKRLDELGVQVNKVAGMDGYKRLRRLWRGFAR